MPNANRDQNFITVGMGVASETVTVGGIDYIAGVTPVPITVDVSTSRLRCKQATPTDGSSASGASTKVQYDQNGNHTVMGETDNAARTPTALSISDTNGGLMMKGD